MSLLEKCLCELEQLFFDQLFSDQLALALLSRGEADFVFTNTN